MSRSSDAARRYGRRGGGWTEAAPTPAKREVAVLPAPAGPESLRRHLVIDHRMQATVVDEHTVEEWLVWHAAEHRHVAEILSHRHDKPSAIELAGSAEHAGRLRAARDGKLPQSVIDEVEERAAYARRRLDQGLVLSAYDRECCEVAQAIAERAARRSRKGRAA